MSLADARAICPDLAREAAALAGLRRWAGRYAAPRVASDGADGLMADISGVPHLFGGEEDLREDLQARLERAGIASVSAIAGSRGAAHALARHGGGIVPDGRFADGIGPLPGAPRPARPTGDVQASKSPKNTHSVTRGNRCRLLELRPRH